MSCAKVKVLSTVVYFSSVPPSVFRESCTSLISHLYDLIMCVVPLLSAEELVMTISALMLEMVN